MSNIFKVCPAQGAEAILTLESDFLSSDPLARCMILYKLINLCVPRYPYL